MFNFLKKADAPAKVEERAVTSASIDNIFSGGTTTSSVYGISTSYACIRLLANTVASTKLVHFETTTKGDEQLSQSRLSGLLKNPEPNVSYFQWMQNMTNQFTGQGNGFSIIIRENGTPIELLYVPEDQVSIYTTIDPNLPYYYQVSKMGKSFRIFPEDMIHFRNMTTNGYTGLAPLSIHRLTFDAASSINDYNKTFMDNATNISGIITTDKNLNKETVEELRTNFGKKFGGATQAGKTPVLTNGMNYTQMKVISPLDADYIANRKMSKSDIAEIYGVPLGMVTNTESKYSNAEQESLNFQQMSIYPMYEMISQEMELKLIPKYSRNKQKLEFVPDKFKLTPSKERSETVSLLANTGIMTPNEARELYGLTKLPGGDELKKEETTQGQSIGTNTQAPKNTENTNPTPGTEAANNATRNFHLDSKEDIEREIQKLKSQLGRIR